MKDMSLIIFDLDGTLVVRDTDEFLPNVPERVAGAASESRIAIATNQGGVGLRLWMERGGFGDPSSLPTEEQAEERILRIMRRLKVVQVGMVFMAFAYQSKKSGLWSPEGSITGDPRWWREWRKPAPGMLLAAMNAAGTTPDKTLMVGDSTEDALAAEAAGCTFMDAAEYFGWGELPGHEGE